jgi:hypothetical protein
MRSVAFVLVAVVMWAPVGLGAQSCDTPITCSAPIVGESCVSGQLYNLETGEVVRAASPTGDSCTQVTVDGPCSIEVAAYDALPFYQNPSSTPPLPATIVVDDCGFYRVSEFPTPALGFLAISSDDASPNDSLVQSAVSMGIPPGVLYDGIRLYVVEAATDQGWTTSAGDPFTGPTFSDEGVFAGIFLNGGTPAQGTALTRSPGGVVPPDDYYFEDTNPYVISTVDSLLDSTGANGAGLMVNSGLVDHSGQGGEMPGCDWPFHLGKSIPGVVVVQEFHSIVRATGERCASPLIFSDGFESGSTNAWSLTVPTPVGFDWAPVTPVIGEFVVFSISGLTALDSADWDFGASGCGTYSQQYSCVPDAGDSCLQAVYRYAESGTMNVSLSVVVDGVARSPIVRAVTVDDSGSCAK